MAASMLTLAPVVVCFLFASRFMKGGNTEGGILVAHSDNVGTWETGLDVIKGSKTLSAMPAGIPVPLSFTVKMPWDSSSE